MLVLVGAWLVLPFTGIELLAVGVAFAIYARHAVDYERIRLFQNRLVIEQVSAEQLTQFEFNPRWVRVEPGATPRDQIKLVSRGETMMIGQHLAQYRRKQFAGELRMWLARVLDVSRHATAFKGSARQRCQRGRGFEWKFWVRKL